MDHTIIKDQGFLPNFCDVSVIFMLVLLVELFALVLSLVSTETGFWDRMALISLFIQWVALTNAALLCMLRHWLNKQSLILNAMLSFMLMMTMTLIFSLLVVFFSEYVGLYAFTQWHTVAYFLVRNLSIAAISYMVVLRYFYIQHQWLLNMEAQSHAQIQALKARIRPHFLFNSMNTIASLIHLDANKAEKSVEDLSDLFRASLTEKTSHSLAEEIALVKSYLDIERLRLGDRLHIEWDKTQVPDDMEVPALCMQPLVENAIYHGIEPTPVGGLIKISAHINDNRLCLSVSNPISTTARPKHRGNQMAQQNIRTRLALMYGKAAKFDILEEQGMYTVSMSIPITN